LIDWLEF